MRDRPVRALLLSRYGELGASSRVRSYQYVPHLRARGIEVAAAPLLSDRYVRALYAGRRLPWSTIVSGYLTRISRLLSQRRHDLLWVEKELLPWWPAWSELALLGRGRPLLLDFDDAVFHRYDRHPSRLVRLCFARKIDTLMRSARLVTAGNDYLAERAREAGAGWVEVLPTVVDVERYTVREEPDEGVFTVGWIGSPGTSRYLDIVAGALGRVSSVAGARLLLVGASADSLSRLPVERRPWRRESEVSDIQEFDVGIMPLPDLAFERGKCGYKLVQYMACGKPVVASPVGVNREIVEPGRNGYLAATEREWTAALGKLAASPQLRTRFGAEGRRKIERDFSLATTSERLAQLMRRAAS